MPSRPPREKTRAGLILVLVLLVFYGPMLLSGHFLFTGVIQDITNIYGFYPWDEFSGQELARGHFPLWNPYNALGLPHLANMQSAPLFPLQWLKYLLGFWTAADLVLLIRLWLAGFFAFLFARQALRSSESAALLSGLAFMLCGYFTRYVYMSHLNVETLLPLTLFIFHRLAQRPGFSLSLSAGLAVFLLVAGGFPEATLYALSLVVSYYLFEILRRRKFRPGLVALGLSLGLGLFLSAAQWLPFAEYLAHAWTYHDPAAGVRHRDLAYAVSLILPWFFGDNALSTLVPFLIPALGLVPFVLALRAALALPRLGPRPLFFFAVALFSAGIAYGLPPFHLLGHLYPFSVTYNDKYAAPILALAVALLAGPGLDRVLQEKNPRLSLAAGALILVWAVANLVAALLNGFYPFFGFGAQSSMIQAAALLAAAALALALGRRGLMPPGAVSAAFLVITAWGLFQDFRGNRPVFEDDRIFQLKAINFLDQSGVYRVTGEEDLFFPNLLLPQRVADLRAYDPLYPKSYVTYMCALNGLSPEQARQHYDQHMLFQIEKDRWTSPLLDVANVVGVALENEIGSEPLAQRLIEEGIEIGPFAGWMRHLPMSLGRTSRQAVLHHAPDLLEAGLGQAQGRTIRFLIGAPGAEEPGTGASPASNPRRGIWAGMTLGPGFRPLYWRYLDPVRDNNRGRWIMAETEPIFDQQPLPRSTALGMSSGRMELAASRLRLLALPGPLGPSESNLLAWSGLRLYHPQVNWPGFERTAEDFDLVALYVNHQAKDRAFLVMGSAVLPGDTPAEQARNFAMLADEVPDLFSSQVLLTQKIEFPWPKTVPEDLKQLPSRMLISEYTPDRVKLYCQSPRPAFLVLSDQYFPGWKAAIGGKETRIYPGHLALRALPVPAGETEITFFYQPWSFRIGLWMLLASGLALLVVRLGRRRDGDDS